MRTSGLRYILVVIACFAIFYILFRDHIPYGRNNTEFAVKPGKDITGIDLIQGDKKTVIRLSGNEWTVNGQNETRKTAVLFLVRILKEIKIKSPVSAEVFRNEIIDRKIEPVRVTVYHKRRPIRSFYVYRTLSNVYGNIMKIRLNSKAYIVYLPGHEENIGSYFIADELFWLPFSAFKLLPSQIESVTLENYSDEKNSFRIIRSGNSFSLAGYDMPPERFDSLKVKRYISYFTSVTFESWALEMTNDERHKIESSQPAFRISVRTNGGAEKQLSIWERVKNMETGEKDTDRVWAAKNDGKGIFVMRYFDLDPILKKKSYFFGV